VRIDDDPNHTIRTNTRGYQMSRVQGRRRARFGAAVAVLVAVGLGIQTTAVTSAGAGQAATPGVTDTTIRVEGLLTKSLYSGADVGAQVVFDKVNAEGGVHGRMIEYVGTLDDNGTNDDNASQARKLVADDVFAAVPVISNFFAGAKILQDNRTPYFGWGFHKEFCKHKEAYSFNGCGLAAEVSKGGNPVWPGLIKKKFPKAKTVGFLVEDTAAAKEGTEEYLKALKKLGLEESFAEFGIPLTNADYTPYVQKAMAANPDVIFLVSSTVGALNMSGALKRAGYQGILTSPAIYDPRVAQAGAAAEALRDVYAYTSFATFDSDNPGIQHMQADVEKYAPAGTLITQPFASGYFSALLLVQMLEAAGKDLTYSNFYKAANGFTYDGDGALGKITFPAAQNTIPLCGSLAVLKADGFEEAQPLTCFKDPAAKKAKS